MAKFEFGFEETWFRLIIKKISEHPDLFLPSAVEKAQTVLRIGKLKVGAARVWAETAGILQKKKQQFSLTPLGRIVGRHDPDMDDDGIWWALHYKLARQNSPAWFYAVYFNEFSQDSFDRGMLEKHLREWWDLDHEKPMTDSTFDKLIFSPFKQVFDGTRLGNDFGFFTAHENGGYHRQPVGYREPPPAIAAYALLDWARQHKRQSVYLEKLMDPWGVGRILRLDRHGLDKLIVEIGDRYEKHVAWISHTAGLNSVSIMDVSPLALVSAHYHELDGEAPLDSLAAGLAEVRELETKLSQDK
ncbi:MAG: DUF4007 family protein [Proteobacteria bacterium]|nr:DUF4007 family protein [Pseudomonadota bacterium]MBU0967622.1 DUF4007 family protein [Pseudomonadota bacterium]